MTKSGIRDSMLIEARTTDIVERLCAAFDLGWMKVNVSFDPKNDDTDRILCETLCDWEYRQVTFRWNLHQLASTNDEDLELTAIHEIVHVLYDPVYSALTDSQRAKFHKLNEMSTENIARVISALLRRAQISQEAIVGGWKGAS